jgi:hypothetical protein
MVERKVEGGGRGDKRQIKERGRRNGRFVENALIKHSHPCTSCLPFALTFILFTFPPFSQFLILISLSYFIYP